MTQIDISCLDMNGNKNNNCLKCQYYIECLKGENYLKIVENSLLLQLPEIKYEKLKPKAIVAYFPNHANRARYCRLSSVEQFKTFIEQYTTCELTYTTTNYLTHVIDFQQFSVLV